MNKDTSWLAGLFSNPKTGQASHTKLPDAPEWAWWAYGAMVGGYALIKRGIAAVPQLAELRQPKEQDDVGNPD